MRGRFFVFEGIDGTGKSTQVRLLAENLRQRGMEVAETFEPSDGPHGRRLREMFSRRHELTLEEELALFMADRMDHVQRVIEPALAAGRTVICDRYYLSTAAYQGAAGADAAAIIRENRNFAPEPDLFLILEAPAAVGRERISRSRREEPNDFEKLEYLEKVAAIFAGFRGGNIVRIDACRSVDEVHRQVLAAVARFL